MENIVFKGSMLSYHFVKEHISLSIFVTNLQKQGFVDPFRPALYLPLALIIQIYKPKANLRCFIYFEPLFYFFLPPSANFTTHFTLCSPL